MYINVPHLGLPGNTNLNFTLPSTSQHTSQNTSGNTFVSQNVHTQGHGRGGEFTYTQCNGVGNINSPCQGNPHQSVPEPGAAALLLFSMLAVVAMRKFKRQPA